MRPVLLIQFIAFLSAFLLFQVELIIAKGFLPNFGGSYMVWGGCVVFFQAVLMLGYKYSQVIVNAFGIQRYRLAHAILAIVPLLSFPGRELPMTFEVLSWPLMLSVFWHLTLFIGPVFFVLSTTSVIWQMWLSSSRLPERHNPYTLFAVSNAGSLAALITYPFIFELYFDLPSQQAIWRVGYFIFVLLQFWACKVIPMQEERPKKTRQKSIPVKRQFIWLAYSGAGVMMFLAVTNIVTAEIAPIPLLWVVPLVIYLISFILNFKKKPYCPQWLQEDIHSVVGLGVVTYFVIQVPLLPVLLDLSLLMVVTYLTCMHVQYQMYRTRPTDHAQLPYYYFVMSLGSLIGGVIVSWVIPLIFTTYVEMFAAFLVIATAVYIEDRRKISINGFTMAFALIILLMMWPLIFSQPDVRFTWVQFMGLGGLLLLVPLIFYNLRKYPAAFVGALVALICTASILESRWALTEYIYRYRNYYGTGKVRLSEGARSLVHGTTIHGVQYIHSAFEHVPLAYYSYLSPVGELLLQDKLAFNRMGVIGLGIGTMATYFKPEQRVDIFELDHDIHQLAQKYFRFLKITEGDVHHYLGDGRLLLEQIPDNTYDLLVIDAFSGDAVPVHLLTEEALKLYQSKLKPDGILLCHISNRYIFLGAPLAKTAANLGAATALKQGHKTEEHDQSSLWMVVTWDKALPPLLNREWGWKKVVPADQSVRGWSDRYSSVLPYIDFEDLVEEFQLFTRAK